MAKNMKENQTFELNCYARAQIMLLEMQLNNMPFKSHVIVLLLCFHSFHSSYIFAFARGV